MFLPFGEAVLHARSLGLKGEKEWRAWQKNGAPPANGKYPVVYISVKDYTLCYIYISFVFFGLPFVIYIYIYIYIYHLQNNRHIIICLVLALFTHHNHPPHFEEVGENISESETRKRNRILNFTPFVRFDSLYSL